TARPLATRSGRRCGAGQYSGGTLGRRDVGWRPAPVSSAGAPTRPRPLITVRRTALPAPESEAGLHLSELPIYEPHGPREECGVVGVHAPGLPVAHLTALGLHALQHRGQESAGIAVSDGSRLTLHKRLGLVGQVFDE